jgi:hypothetical protein
LTQSEIKGNAMDLSLQTGLSGWLISLLANAHRVFRTNDLEQQKLLLAQSELIEAKDALERKSEELKLAADHLGFLMQELSHRSKNLLAVIQAMAGQSAKTSTSIEDFRQRFSLRLRGLAASHDLLVQQNWESGDLAELVARQLAAFAESIDGGLDIDGPSVSLDAGRGTKCWTAASRAGDQRVQIRGAIGAGRQGHHPMESRCRRKQAAPFASELDRARRSRHRRARAQGLWPGGDRAHGGASPQRLGVGRIPAGGPCLHV